MRLLLLVALGVCLSTASAFAENIAVPDLETRIKNAGNAVPESALPQIKPPLPSDLPAPDPVPSAVPVPTVTPTVPAVIATAPVEPTVAVSVPSFMSGFLELGAGSPAALNGIVSLTRQSGDLPGFSIDFRHSTADGFGTAKAGTGFFDRKTTLSAQVFNDSATKDRFVSITLSDRTDGFQGRSDAFSLAHREVSWTGGLHAVPLSDAGWYGSLDFDGSVFTAFADMSGTAATNPAPFPAYTGYYLSPRAAIGFETGAFSAELFGRYGHETLDQPGSVNDGQAGIALRYTRWDTLIEAEVSAFADSTEGLTAPFRLTVSRDSAESALRGLTISGGLDTRRVSPWQLAEAEPFVALTGNSVYASDWFGLLDMSVSPADNWTVDVGGEYRKTAFGRGTLAVFDEINPADERIPLVLVDRDSLVTRAALAWNGSGKTITAGYSGERLDRLYRDSVQTLEAGITIFDAGTESLAGTRLWEASVNGVFALDSDALPALNLKGTVRPFRKLAVTLAVNDALTIALGKNRTRNGGYTERSGELTLSARIDF